MNRTLKKMALFLTLIIGFQFQVATASNIEDEKQTPQVTLSLWQVPLHFVTTLFDPFINEDAQNFYSNQINEVQNKGIVGYTSNKATDFYNLMAKNSLGDNLTLISAVGLTWTGLGEYLPVAPVVLTTFNTFKTTKSYVDLGNSVLENSVSHEYLKKTMRIALYGLAIYGVSSLPIAYGHQVLTNCKVPDGTFSGSCTDIQVSPYQSTDPLVPNTSCKLSALCKTTHESIKPKENILFYDYLETPILGNNNGTLTVNGYSMKKPENFQCVLPEGSYQKTCQLSVTKYVSPDQNLSNTPLCNLVSNCKKYDRANTQANVVIYGHSFKKNIENCDGKVVFHHSKETDGFCDNISHTVLKERLNSLEKNDYVVKTKDEL